MIDNQLSLILQIIFYFLLKRKLYNLRYVAQSKMTFKQYTTALKVSECF